MLNLSLNGESTQCPLDCSLTEVIAAAGFNGEKVAVAVNGEFVPRSHYGATLLSEGDCIDIVKPVGGG